MSGWFVSLHQCHVFFSRLSHTHNHTTTSFPVTRNCYHVGYVGPSLLRLIAMLCGSSICPIEIVLLDVPLLL